MFETPLGVTAMPEDARPVREVQLAAVDPERRSEDLEYSVGTHDRVVLMREVAKALVGGRLTKADRLKLEGTVRRGRPSHPLHAFPGGRCDWIRVM